MRAHSTGRHCTAQARKKAILWRFHRAQQNGRSRVPKESRATALGRPRAVELRQRALFCGGFFWTIVDYIAKLVNGYFATRENSNDLQIAAHGPNVATQ